MNLVRAAEPDPPEGRTAVSWTLLTDLPAGTRAQCRAVLAVFRHRLLVEELHNAMKTGLKPEANQLIRIWFIPRASTPPEEASGVHKASAVSPNGAQRLRRGSPGRPGAIVIGERNPRRSRWALFVPFRMPSPWGAQPGLRPERKG